MADRRVAGVDWAGGQWFAVVLDDDSSVECYLKEEFVALWDAVSVVDEMLVDVPIGLPDDEDTLRRREELDSLARSVTGRSSSVFPVPSRQACVLAWCDEETYKRVASQNEGDLDKGLSKQSYSIAEACGEVDEFLLSNAGKHDKVIESHPEVCFRGLSGRQLQYSKNSAAGLGERLEALDQHLETPGAKLREICSEIPQKSNEDGVGGVTVDDVLDAIGLATTALKRKEECYALPHDDTFTDTEDLPIQMAYLSEEPLL